MKNKILSLLLAIVLVTGLLGSAAINAIAEDRPIPRNAAGVPSPLGYYFVDTYYDMWPEESGGVEGVSRWAMDKDGYFTITLEAGGNNPFHFTNSYRGTQARFGGMVVGGGGGGGGGSSNHGGYGGDGGQAYVQYWAEPFWNDESSQAYGQFYSPDHYTPTGWYINDYLYNESFTVTIGPGGSRGEGFDFYENDPKRSNYTGKRGNNGSPSGFAGVAVSGGSGGGHDSGIDRPANKTYGSNGSITDSTGANVRSIYDEITFWGANVNVGRGGGNGGKSAATYYWGYNVPGFPFDVGHEANPFESCYAIGGNRSAGPGNGGGGAGINCGFGHDVQGYYGSPMRTRDSAGGSGGSYGVIILEGKADLVTLRVYKETDDSPANRINPMDTTVLKGIEYYVHCEEGYVEDFIIVTNNLGVAERGSLPLAHYTVTEITQTDRMQGYICYQLGPVFNLDGIERFWKPDEIIYYGEPEQPQ